MAILKSTLGQLCLASLLFSFTFAASVNEVQGLSLVKRVTGDRESDPIQASFDITGWEDIAEEYCYIMLCILNGRRVYRRNDNPGDDGPHRTASGERNQPFQDYGIEHYHTTRIADSTQSPEEFPWASIADNDNWTRHVVSATLAQQGAQGTGTSNGLRPVTYGHWFKITFTPATSFGRYCTALHQDPPDTTVCRKKKDLTQTLFGVAKVAIGGYVYHKLKDGNKVNFAPSGRRDAETDAIFAPSLSSVEFEARSEGFEPSQPMLEPSADEEKREITYHA